METKSLLSVNMNFIKEDNENGQNLTRSRNLILETQILKNLILQTN